MIDLIFYYGSEIIFVRVSGNNILFSNSSQLDKGTVPIDNLKLSKSGAIKTFPDLKDREDWREQAINRFKYRISMFEDEETKAQYVIDELKQYGYVPKFYQKMGFRRKNLS